MKTPREILLQKHSSAESKLDAIRAGMLQELQPQAQPAANPLPFGLTQIWNQLILPSRRIWAGLAMLWLVAAALNFATPDDLSPRYTAAPVPTATPERQMALQEQQQLFAELLHEPVRAQREERRPQPRSQAPLVVRYV